MERKLYYLKLISYAVILQTYVYYPRYTTNHIFSKNAEYHNTYLVHYYSIYVTYFPNYHRYTKNDTFFKNANHLKYATYCKKHDIVEIPCI